MPINVHENRIPLYVGIADTVLFLLALIFSTHSGLQNNDMTIIIFCVPIFGGFVLLGIYLLLDYFRRHLLFHENEMTYYPVLGKPKSFPYQDIHYIIYNPNSMGTSYRLFNQQDHKICVFESNMINAPKAIKHLQAKGILLRPVNMKDKGARLPQFSIRSENAKKETNAFIKERYAKSQIKKARKCLKILNYGLLGLCAISYFLEGKWFILGYLSIPWFCWIVYVYFYPRMIVEPQSSIKHNMWFIGFPITPCAIALLLLLIPESFINMDWNTEIQFTFLTMIVLIIPFIIVVYIRKCKIYLPRILCVLACALLLAFLSTPLINYCTASKQVGHEEVFVKKKYVSTSKYRDTYYIKVVWNDEIQELKVSRNVYKTINDYDIVKICIKESIFQVPFWIVHK